MKIKSFFITAVLTIAVLCSFGVANAQVDNSALIAQLQAQIAQLLAQLKVLQAQQGTTPAWCHTFNNYLVAGNNNQEIDDLRTALYNDGEHLPIAGGVNGTNFDDDVAAAVVAFQAKYGIRQTGTVGPITRTKLNSLYGCGTTPVPNPTPTPTPTPTPASTLTSNMILNSNGFVNGQKPLQGMPGGEGLNSIVIGNDSDGTQEAVAIDTWCSASCGETLYAFKLVNNSVSMVKLPGSGVAGAAQKISSIQINSGIISDVETDFSGTRTNYWQLSLVNGVLQANKTNQTPAPTNGLTLNALKNMYVDDQHQLNNGQYLSPVIDCTGIHGTCPGGQRLYVGLDSSSAVFGDFNNDGTQEAVVGIRTGYVDNKDDLVTAPADVKGEFMALVELVNGQPKIIDKIYGPTDIFGTWERINSIVFNNGQFTVDATEIVNYNDTTGQHEIRRVYQINVSGNKLNIISVAPYSVG